MIDDKAAQKIRAWQPGKPLTLGILDSDHPTQPAFEAFAGDFARLCPKVAWKKGEKGDLPGFLLRENLLFSALPLERELLPFLAGLSCLEKETLDKETAAMVDRITLPCQLTLYIALHCPHCPAMVEALIPLAVRNHRIRLEIIDGSLFPEKAEKDRVLSAPCLILDQDFRWTGVVAPDEILAMILDRDLSRLSAQTLRSILEQGQADWITDQMTASGKIFAAFFDLLVHETWSVRLGAMVVVETLAEKDPRLAMKLAPGLTGRFDKMDLPVQGDILYVLGQIGNLETKAWIYERIGTNAHSDLKDAAQDAMDAIDSRFTD